MKLEPRLIDVAVPANPDGVVLVLHGGARRIGRPWVSPAQLSVLRMVPIARCIAREAQGQLAVYRLLNSRRGWDETHTPVQDARWALDRIAERLGNRPTCLVGHSLGGRAALLCADRPEVRSVVALAPWVYATDLPEGKVRARVLIVHGSRDRVAPPGRAQALADALSARADVTYLTVDGGTHGMLRHREQFDVRAARFAVETLLHTHAQGAARPGHASNAPLVADPAHRPR